MTLEPTRQQIVDDTIREAHERCGAITGDVALAIVEALDELTAYGHPWVAAYIDDLKRSGAAKVYADWRRRYQIQTTTAKGTPVSIPGFGAVTVVDEAGEQSIVHLRLPGMDIDQARQHRNKLAKQRNTLSVEVRLLDDLIAMMEADVTLATVGDALARLEAAA